MTHRERDAEVCDERGAIVQQDVLRLDVAVDHAVAMRVVERGADLLGEAHGIVDGQLVLAIQAIAQRLALDERHHVEEVAVRLPRVEQREDVRMLQRRRRLDLGQEAIGANDGGELWAQHLHRDAAIVLEIVRQIHGRHAARAELALESIAIGERLNEARRGVFHMLSWWWGHRRQGKGTAHGCPRL